MRIAAAEAKLGVPNDESLRKVSDLLGEDRSQNANPFVPWTNSDTPFECECGAIIYADTSHSHGG